MYASKSLKVSQYRGNNKTGDLYADREWVNDRLWFNGLTQ